MALMNKLKVWFSFLLRELVLHRGRGNDLRFLCYIRVTHMCVNQQYITGNSTSILQHDYKQR